MKVAIVGASGPTGWHLARELHSRGDRVRVIGRREAKLAELFPMLERRTADAVDVDDVKTAIEGSDVVIDCIGTPPAEIGIHPITARSIASAARATGASIVHVSSFWAYLPIRYLPLDEKHPRDDGNRFIVARREAEDVLLDAGAAIAHLPDFFGPEVHTSTLQRALEEIVDGKPVNWIGSRDVEREYAFVPDATRIIAELARTREAFGKRWIVPGAGPLSLDRLVKIAERHTNVRVRTRTAGVLTLKMASLFLPSLREFLPMAPHYVRPISYDGSRLRALLGELPVTPYEESVPATLGWLRARRAGAPVARVDLTRSE